MSSNSKKKISRKRGRSDLKESRTSEISNPLLKEFKERKKEWPKELRENDLFSPDIEDFDRVDLFNTMGDDGAELQEKYAWAIPDEKALRILSHFSPLVEIGAGNGYWARLLQDRGVDIIAYDQIGLSKDDTRLPESMHTVVKKGGPKKLDKLPGRTLFLCYPDNVSDLAIECLEHFTGNTIIHVGELIHDGTLSLMQAPWGRTTTEDFQQELMAKFHCILRKSLPHYATGRDTLTVWKRSMTCPVFMPPDDDDDDEDDGEAAAGEAQWWRHIPKEERLPVDAAAPCVEHLLN